MKSRQLVDSNVRRFGTLLAFLSWLVMAVVILPIHHHDNWETALYDQECPAMQLAVSARGVGLALRPLTDLGAAPLAPDTVSLPPLRAVLNITARPAGVRAPPLFA